jgi:hypothetical protein
MSSDRPVEDLEDLLAGVDPARRPGEFVFVTVDTPADIPGGAAATVVEDGRVSCVVEVEVALTRGQAAEPRLAWITLRVHSSLTAVGLTAAVAGALSSRGIAANVIAGHRHDHVLVPVDRADEAVAVITALAQR